MPKKSLFTVVLCYTIWGVMPLYWHLLANVSPTLVLCCRLIFGALFCVLLLCCMKRFADIPALFKNKAAMRYLLVAAPVICINWGVYIWAIGAGHTLDASLGYYMNPLLVFVFSILLFKEKCGGIQLIAIIVAIAGVAISVLVYGRFPYVALILALSFAAYGVIKKKAHADPIVSTAVETLSVTPFFLLFCLFFQRESIAALQGAEPLLLVIGGALTVVPLMLYASSVNHLPFVTVGFAQYICPTLMGVCGVLMGETLTPDKLLSLLFILAALLIYSVGMVRDYKKAKREEAAKASI